MDVLDNKIALPGVEKFTTIQDILDQNKILINEISLNHEARTPEGLARNVVLIRELNSNVAKVIDLYKEITASFEDLARDEADAEGLAEPRPG